MKRIVYLPILFLFIFLFMSAAFVQGQPIMKEKSKSTINRTATVVQTAYKYTLANQVFTGNLKKAVIHQRVAIALYMDGKYVKAIHQSHRAREFARLQIEANSGVFPPEFESTSDETPYGPAPSADELDAEAASSIINTSVADDKTLINQPLNNIDVTE